MKIMIKLVYIRTTKISFENKVNINNKKNLNDATSNINLEL